MVLKPQTRIQLVRRYNKASRTVILTSGEAFFEISHHEELPFIVDMETASIKDIGTSFTVQKTEDSIKVMVFSGKVAFSKKEAREAMEISAGSSLCFYIREERFGEIRATGATCRYFHGLSGLFFTKSHFTAEYHDFYTVFRFLHRKTCSDILNAGSFHVYNKR